MNRRFASDASGPSSGFGAFRFLAWWGSAWGSLCFVAFRFRFASETRGAESFALLALCALVALGHACAWLWFRRAFALLPGSSRSPRFTDLLFASLFGLVYAGLALSLLKYDLARAHLRYEDLWFVFGNLRQLGGEGSPRERLLLFVAVLLPMALAALAYRGLRRARRDPRALPLATLVLLSILTCAGLVALWLGSAGSRQAIRNFLPGLHTLSARLAAEPPRPEVGGGSTYRADPGRQERIGPPPPQTPAPRDNVVVLMLESVPWSRLFGPLARAEATPRLEALAAESIVFARAYATATHSDYAQTSILSSLHPRKFDRHDYFVDLAYPRTLIWDVLRPAGYRTALFSCQNESWGNMRSFLRTPGLELFRHSPDWPDAPRRGEGAESKVFEPTPVEAFRSWLDGVRGGPFLAYLNFQATHYPYVADPDLEPLYRPDTIDFPTTFLSYPREKIPVMENRFYNALHAVDRAVGEVVDALRAAGVWDRTVLLVVSDHGEAFYEHGVPTHGTTLLEEQVRTATLLRLPGAAPRVVQEPVSVLDLVPTIVRHLGLPQPGGFQGRSDVLEASYSARGRPLLFTIQGITHEDGLLLDDWKLLQNLDRRERALFDLASDPEERHNLAGTRGDRLALLDRQLAALLSDQLTYYRDRGWESGWYAPKLP